MEENIEEKREDIFAKQMAKYSEKLLKCSNPRKALGILRKILKKYKNYLEVKLVNRVETLIKEVRELSTIGIDVYKEEEEKLNKKIRGLIIKWIKEGYLERGTKVKYIFPYVKKGKVIIVLSEKIRGELPGVKPLNQLESDKKQMIIQRIKKIVYDEVVHNILIFFAKVYIGREKDKIEERKKEYIDIIRDSQNLEEILEKIRNRIEVDIRLEELSEIQVLGIENIRNLKELYKVKISQSIKRKVINKVEKEELKYINAEDIRDLLGRTFIIDVSQERLKNLVEKIEELVDILDDIEDAGDWYSILIDSFIINQMYNIFELLDEEKRKKLLEKIEEMNGEALFSKKEARFSRAFEQSKTERREELIKMGILNEILDKLKKLKEKIEIMENEKKERLSKQDTERISNNEYIKYWKEVVSELKKRFSEDKNSRNL